MWIAKAVGIVGKMVTRCDVADDGVGDGGRNCCMLCCCSGGDGVVVVVKR